MVSPPSWVPLNLPRAVAPPAAVRPSVGAGAPSAAIASAGPRATPGRARVASLRECRAAVRLLAARLAAADGSVRDHVQDRTVSCRLTDLDVTIRGRLSGGELVDVTEAVSS